MVKTALGDRTGGLSEGHGYLHGAVRGKQCDIGRREEELSVTHGKDGFIRIREPDPATLRSASAELTLPNVAVAGNARSGGRSDPGPASQPAPVDHPSHRHFARGEGPPRFGVQRAEKLRTTEALSGRSGGQPGCGRGGHRPGTSSPGPAALLTY